MDLESLKERAQKDPQLFFYFLEELVQSPPEGISELIENLIEAFGHEKPYLKAIKKAVFRLKQKGVKVTLPEEGKRSILRPVQLPEPVGYVALFDQTGRLFVAIGRETTQGVIVQAALGSFGEGILDYVSSYLTKKGWRRFIEGQKGITEAVEAPAAYCALLLKEMAEKGTPQGFEETSPLLSSLSYHGPKPLIKSLTGEVSDRAPLKAKAVFDVLPLLGIWSVDEERIKKLKEELFEVEQSPLFLTEAQKAQRKEDLLQKALLEILNDGTREALKRTLEEVSYVFFKSGKEELSRLCLSLSLEFEKVPSPLLANPLLSVWLSKLLQAL